MNFTERFPRTNDIWLFSNPEKAQRKAFQIYGPNAVIYKSQAKNKKYYIITPEGKKVNFGQMGYEDYTFHNDANRRNNYLRRTENMKGDWKSNGYSANNLARNILW